MPGGITGLLGSMLIVMFSYCGFEVIGLAASEAEDVQKTIPKAIRYTVLSLVVLYILYIAVLLPLIPTSTLNENTSAIVASLSLNGIGWAGTVIGAVIVSAILSTMLATMFGLGRMMRSLARERQAPAWLREKTDVPYRGILASGAAMLAALWFGLLLPRVYLFLISSGRFCHSLYVRRYDGLTFALSPAVWLPPPPPRPPPPPDGKCQMRGYPYSTIFVMVSLIIAIASMPFVKGQTSGLIAGLVLLAFFEISYTVMTYMRNRRGEGLPFTVDQRQNMATEFSEELTDTDKREITDDSLKDD